MASKETRWFEVHGETLFIYDRPDPLKACSMTFTRLTDLPYYRRHFRLLKVEAAFAAN